MLPSSMTAAELLEARRVAKSVGISAAQVGFSAHPVQLMAPTGRSSALPQLSLLLLLPLPRRAQSSPLLRSLSAVLPRDLFSECLQLVH